MKILHIINEAQVGGAQTLIEALSDPSHRRPGDEIQLAVLLAEDTLSERYAVAFDKVHYIRLHRRRPNVFRALRELQAMVNDFKPDIVHTHLEQSDLLGLFLRIGDAARVTTIHTSGYSDEDHQLTKIIAGFVGRASKRFQAVIASDDSSLPFMDVTGYSFPRDRVRVIRNGVQVPEHIEYNADADAFICLARYHPMKSYDILFEAFHQLIANRPTWKLICAGSGMDDSNQDVARLLDTYTPAQRSNVELRGPLANIVPALRDASALVLASSYGETFPLVGMEGAREGLPVIITDIGGSKAFTVSDDFVVEPGSVDDLYRALEKFASASSERKAELSAQSRDLAQREFSIDATVVKYNEVYDEALAWKRGIKVSASADSSQTVSA